MSTEEQNKVLCAYSTLVVVVTRRMDDRGIHSGGSSLVLDSSFLSDLWTVEET